MNKYGKIAIIPDSFKGTMTAAEVCDTLRAAFAAALPGADIVGIPAADGGEGTVDAFLYAAGGRRIFVDTENALGEPIRAAYGILPDGTAVIETAAASGLPQVEGRNDPLAADTFGTGRLLLDAWIKGAAASFWDWAAARPPISAPARCGRWASAFGTKPAVSCRAAGI